VADGVKDEAREPPAGWSVLPFLNRNRSANRAVRQQEGKFMLWTIVVILLILWVLGFSVLHIGSLIHLLLVVALVVVVVRLIQGRRVV
jgi:Ca2+/Na+ antiporter